MPPVSPDESRQLRNEALTQRDAWCQLTTPDGPPYGRLPLERKALRSIPASRAPIPRIGPVVTPEVTTL